MLTLDELDELERCAAPCQRSTSSGERQARGIATFEHAASPYRKLVRSARRLLVQGRCITPELERELRHGARLLALARRKLG